jgi:hypothetical protein
MKAQSDGDESFLDDERDEDFARQERVFERNQTLDLMLWKPAAVEPAMTA